MTIVEQLRQEYATKIQEGNDLLALAGKEGRDLTAEEVAANDARFSRLDAITKQIEQGEKFAAMKLKNGEAAPATPPGKAEFEAANGNASEIIVGETKVDPRLFNEAAREYLLTGAVSSKFATITSATSNGLLVPRSISAPLVPTTANAYRAALTAAGGTVIETPNTQGMSMPVMSGTAGGVVAENATTELESAPSYGSINLDVKTYQSQSVWFSGQLLAATSFDLVGVTLPQLTFQKELGLESFITATLLADAGITQIVNTATTSTFTYQNLVSLNRKLPSAFDSMKAIILGRAAFEQAEGILGSDGHPVLVPDPVNQSLTRFNGTPVVRSDFLEAFGASKCIAAVISAWGFKLRDVTQQNLARYVNIPQRPNQTGLDLFAYHGFGWYPNAVAKLMTPAS